MSEGVRVCLIDDDIFVRDALAQALRDHGYVVKAAPGAAAGLDLVERERIEVIVTDMRMPGTTGAQLLEQARARWPSMPIIAISGASEIDGVNVREAARALGADALLAKPFLAAELIAAVEQALAARRGGGGAEG